MKLLKSLTQAKPDFFIIGAMKSGTTSLYQYLNFHNRVESTLIKEPCYYSYNFANGKKWYLKQFPKKALFARKKWYFDASPVYLHDAESAARVYADYPAAKIIIMCRDPIARSVSHYNYYSSKDSNFGKNEKNTIDTRSVEQAFRDDMAGEEKRPFFRYCRMSRYAAQAQKFIELFGPSNVLFLDTAELDEDVHAVMLRVSQFLGLPDSQQFLNIPTTSQKVDSKQSFEKDSEKKFKRFNSLEYSIDVSPELENELVAFFKPDVEKLQQISGVDFSWTARYGV